MPVMCLGLVLLGVGLEHLWNWAFIAFFWGLFVFAVMTSTVTISGDYTNPNSSLTKQV